MIRLFTGHDPREAEGLAVFIHSVLKYASEPVSIAPLGGKQKDGTNRFTYSRFQVPQLCNFEGWAIFADGCDMLMQADIAELWNLRDEKYAVMCVKHDYQTRHPLKYQGTAMEAKNQDYPRKNWSSLMLWNCGHPANKAVIESQQFAWLTDDLIGDLPRTWNVLVDEEIPKILHWTAGMPGFKAYQDAPMAHAWHLTRAEMQTV